MRNLVIALIGLVVLAGGAVAVGVSMNGNANMTADVNGHHLDGKGDVSASDKGVSAAAGADAGPAKADGSATATTTLPDAPAMPKLPQPDLPTLPDVSGGTSGSGSGSGAVTVP